MQWGVSIMQQDVQEVSNRKSHDGMDLAEPQSKCIIQAYKIGTDEDFHIYGFWQ